MSNKEDELLNPDADRSATNPVKTVTITKVPIIIAVVFFGIIMFVLVSNSNNKSAELQQQAITAGGKTTSSHYDAKMMVDSIAYNVEKRKDAPPPTGVIESINYSEQESVESFEPVLSDHEIQVKQLREQMFISSLTENISPIEKRHTEIYKQRKAMASSNNGSDFSNNPGIVSSGSNMSNAWLQDEQARIEAAMAKNEMDGLSAGNTNFPSLVPNPQFDMTNPPTTGGGGGGLAAIAASMSGSNNSNASQANARDNTRDWNLNAQITAKPKNPFLLQTGAVINGVLQTEINDNLSEGLVTAVISSNVYDSITGRYLLIPQGSKLLGQFEKNGGGNGGTASQERLMVIWDRIMFPDGRTLDILGMEGSDAMGRAGFSDRVNTHFWKNAGNALLLSLVGAGVGYTLDKSENNNNGNNNNTSFKSEMASQMAYQFGNLSTKVIENGLNLAPTLEIRAGYQFNIVVNKDIAFPQPYNFRE